MTHNHVPLRKSPLTLKTVISANSGHLLPEEPWAAAGERYAELVRQSAEIAAKLQKAGIDPYRPDTLPVCTVGLLSGEFKEVIPYRNSNLIPVIQSANHREALKILEYYCKSRPFIRMFVITSGDRCPVNAIGKRHRELGRKISKWAASDLCKENKVEVIFARHEITFDVLHAAHFHAHVLVHPHKKLGPKEWGDFLDATHKFFDTKILDSGKLRKPQEAVKYCLKPAEIGKLSDNNVAELYRQLHRQKLVRFMGGLLDFRKELRKDQLKVGKIKRKRGGVASWEHCLVKKEGNGGAKYAKKSSTPPSDIVMGITPPCAIFRPMMEPCLVVGAFSGDVEALLQKRGLQKWKDAALHSAKGGVSEAATAAPSTVHTSTTTVQPVLPTPPAETPDAKALVSTSEPEPSPVKTGRVYRLKPDSSPMSALDSILPRKKTEKK